MNKIYIYIGMILFGIGAFALLTTIVLFLVFPESIAQLEKGPFFIDGAFLGFIVTTLLFYNMLRRLKKDENEALRQENLRIKSEVEKYKQRNFQTLAAAVEQISDSIADACKSKHESEGDVLIEVTGMSLKPLGQVLEDCLKLVEVKCGGLVKRVRFKVFHVNSHVLSRITRKSPGDDKLSTYFIHLAHSLEIAKSDIRKICEEYGIKIEFVAFDWIPSSYTIVIDDRYVYWGYIKWIESVVGNKTKTSFKTYKCFFMDSSDEVVPDFIDWIKNQTLVREILTPHPGCFFFNDMESAAEDLLLYHKDVERVRIISYIGNHEMRCLEQLYQLVPEPTDDMTTKTNEGLKEVKVLWRDWNSGWKFPAYNLAEARKIRVKSNVATLKASARYSHLQSILDVKLYDHVPVVRAILAEGKTPDSRVGYIGFYPVVDGGHGPDFSARNNGGVLKITGASLDGQDLLGDFIKWFDYVHQEIDAPEPFEEWRENKVNRVDKRVGS